MGQQKRNFLWPDVSTIDSAKRASMYGFWAAIVSAVFTAIVASWALGAQKEALGFVGAYAFVDALLFSLVAVGIYKESRFAALAGLVLFTIEKVDQVSKTGRADGVIIAITLIVCYVASIRGTYALRQLRTAAPSTDSPS